MKEQMIFQRYEFKYLLTKNQLQAVLLAAKPHIVPDAYSHSSIRNIYLDTPDFRLIRRSLEKPVYKEKVRLRSYGTAEAGDSVFVELKKKYQSVVYKRRLSMEREQAMACVFGKNPWPDTQIGQELAYAMNFYGGLRPAAFLSYERDAYQGVEDPQLRMTFDSRILYRRQGLSLGAEPWGVPLLGADQVLMELKVAGGLPLWLARVLSSQGIYKTSFSKYGAAYQDKPEQYRGLGRTVRGG